MDRKEELLNIIEHDPALIPLVDEMVYLECELEKLRKLPKIRVHPDDPTKQKLTPASKQYKEFLQQYVNIVRTIVRATHSEEEEQESPLRKWLNEHLDQAE